MISDKQKAAREQALGSSDAPIACGVSRRCSPAELFYKFTGQLPRYDANETLLQKIGTRLQPVIAELVAEELNIKIRQAPERHHPKHTFMVAHSDYEIVSNPKGPGNFEIKNRAGEKPWETPPDDVVIQTVHQMACWNRDYTIVGGLFQFGQIKDYLIERDKELEEYVIEIEHRFIRCVERGECPDHTWTPETLGILKKLYPADTGKVIELPESFREAANMFLLAKMEIDAGEAHKAEWEGKLKSAMGDASQATVEGYSISWKSTKPSQKFDVEQFEKDHPDLFKQYQKPVPGHRRFSVKPTGEITK